MYKRRRPQLLWGKILLVSVLSISLFLISKGFVYVQPVLLPFLQKVTMVSVLTSHPKQSLELLEMRFRSQLIEPQEFEAPPKEEPVLQAEQLEENEAPEPIEDTAEDAEPEPDPEPVQETQIPHLEPKPIPKQYQGPVIEENMCGKKRVGVIAYKNGLVRNDTKVSNEEVNEILSEPDPLKLPKKGPQVLIYHTHATESFETVDSAVYDTRHTWRSTDNAENIVAVGNEMEAAIKKWGIEVIHDTTQHDYPSYNGSYERSVKTMEQYLEEYPSICVTLDIHRDAIQRNDTLIKPVFRFNGEKAAQLMIISGCDDGTMNMPRWRDNLRFAAGIQNQMEARYPGLTRPIFFCYRRYNMHMTPASLLIEVGSHGNTLEEVMRAGRMAGDAIGEYLSQHISSEEG